MINYPNGKRNPTTKLVNHDTSGRGISLEQDLNESNEYYLIQNKAIIHKKPTPVQIVKVDYPSRHKAKIVEAYFKIPSTTDYNGIYRGKYIDFEAKEISKNNFPFQNIHPHQIEHLRKVIEHGGIAFIVMCFTKKNEVYLIKASDIIERYDKKVKKSISYEEVVEIGYLIKQGYMPKLNYLYIVDEVFFKKEEL